MLHTTARLLSVMRQDVAGATFLVPGRELG